MDREQVSCYIIDDEPKALKLLERLLALVVPEWRIMCFSSSKQLLQQCAEDPPDVLFSDIEMPDLSGFQLLEKMKELSLQPVTIFVTAYDHYAIKAIKAAVLDYLVKPVDIDDLHQAVIRIKEKLAAPSISTGIDRLPELTPTEKEVLKVLARGTTSAAAAKILNSSPHTINTHRNNILKKLGCKSILEVVNLVHLSQQS